MFQKAKNLISRAASAVKNTVSSVASKVGSAVKSALPGQVASVGALDFNNPLNKKIEAQRANQPSYGTPEYYANSPAYQKATGNNLTPTGSSGGVSYYNDNPPPVQRPVSFSAGSKPATSTTPFNSASDYSTPSYTSNLSASSTLSPQPVSQTISSGTLGAGTPSIITPSAPTPTNYASQVTGGNIAVGGDTTTGLINASLNPHDAPGYDPAKDPTSSAYKSDARRNLDDMLAKLQKPPSEADAYEEAARKANLEQARIQRNNTQNAINAVTAKMNADLLQLRGVAAKEGVVEAVYGGQAAEITREATIKLLPLQAQLAADQGNLELAQENTNTLFKMYMSDAKNSVEFYNNQVKAIYDFVKDEDKKKLDEKKEQKQLNADIIKQDIKDQNDLAQKFAETGNWTAYRAITSIRPPTNVNSPTFAEDYKNYRQDISEAFQRFSSNVSNNQVNVPNLGTVNGNVLALAQEYTSTGTLPSSTDLKAAGTNYNEVVNLAKQLPRRTGEIVDARTGVKANIADEKIDGFAALRDIHLKLNELETRFKDIVPGVVGGIVGTVVGSDDLKAYLDLRGEIVDLLARARTGAALTKDEEEFYKKKLPTRFSNSFFLGTSGEKRIADFKEQIGNTLQTKLNAQGAVMYGFSKIEIGGNEYTVGDVVTNASGQTGRVLPDGTIKIDESFSEVGNTTASNQVKGYMDQIPPMQEIRVEQIVDAIKQVESGGDYNARGASGEGGAFQFMPSTWKQWAGEYLGNPNAPMTPQNQETVARAKVNDLLKQGYDEREIALIWNGGTPKVKRGVNKFGVPYDSGAYADKVLRAIK